MLFVKWVRGMCFYGLVVFELVSVVIGCIDVYIMMRFVLWDYAVGCVFLNEVGGIYMIIDGELFMFLENYSVFVGNLVIYKIIFGDYLYVDR